MSRLTAQTGMELRLLLRNAENLTVTFGIPVGLLVFFSVVSVLPVPEGQSAVSFLAPGILALSVIGAAMVSLGIQTGFERFYLVLKRLGATPLRRGELIGAKVLSILAIEVVQVAVVVSVAVALGWRPAVGSLALLPVALLLGTAAFAGIGMAMAGRLRALATLALVNAVFVVLLLSSGILFPLDRLPEVMQAAARILPAAPLADWLRAAFGGPVIPTTSVVSLFGWAVIAPAVAARLFRWE
ncbi:ABC transporter permease [Euzebya tangerina]|uniref:ABC transporter permease n=1 Tax=Euzebya tangerina TaxID=591198 RepID=UPI00196A4A92|nr:ABC transporter permease [Euzebya tangerina]